MSASAQPWLHELVTVLGAPTVALSEHSGQIRPRGAQGVLHADARVLSAVVLEVGGAEPAPVSSGLLGAGRALFISAARQLGEDIPDPTVRIERERVVSPGQVRERIRVISAAGAPVSTELTVRLAADLAGIGVIKAGQAGLAGQHPARITVLTGGSGAAPGGQAPGRQPPNGQAGAGQAQHGQAQHGQDQHGQDPDGQDPDGPDPEGQDSGGHPAGGHPVADSAELAWGDGPLRVRLSAPGAAATTADHGRTALLRWPVRLGPRGRAEVGWEITVRDPAAVVTAAADLAARATSWSGVRAGGDDPRLGRLLARALPDASALRMATARSPGDVFLAGGAPWYLTLFGRDSIWAARLMLPFGWRLAAGTLRALAALQGTQVNGETGEAPGKIPHELRTAGRQAAGGLPPLYYGTIDATPLWVCLLHDAWRWGMPAAQVRELLPSLTAALACLRDYGDADGDGFLEYIDQSGHGLANQGWKDSGDAIRFASGQIAAPPVALCEVQGYAYEAASRGADLLEALGEPGAGQWRSWAAQLAAAFRSAFWVNGPAGAYPALALDAAKRPVDSLTSNIGHLLGTGLLTPAEESRAAARLAGPDMDSGYGLRTMSADSGGYNPLSYHCGSVWSHDTAIVIRGLAVSGHPAQAARLAGELLDAAGEFGWRLPELFGGDARALVPWPSPYPASCRPQAWAAAAAGALVQALLGLDADVPGGRVSIAPPPARPDGAGQRLHVDGLVAGDDTFSAGIDADGEGYLRGLSPMLAAVSR
ncbi:MAG TPA: glycogen debranching N-terminal domain-containing protein [Streptosporangiaceae bacterium]